MKKLNLKSMLVGMLIGSISITTVFAANEIKSVSFNSNKVIFDGTELNLGKQKLISIVTEGEENGSNYMPVRGVLEALGYTVDWDANKNAIIISSSQVTTKQEPFSNMDKTELPIAISSCKVEYENTPYKWPFIKQSITNTSDKTVIGYQTVLLAYDKDGEPLELYWDARNVDESGDYGNVGFGNGIDYGKVVGIKPYSSKSYDWLIDRNANISPSLTKTEEDWNLFDGWWDQPNGVHKASYILACVKQVTFEDKSIWENPNYDTWIKTYKGKAVKLETLKSYYAN